MRSNDLHGLEPSVPLAPLTTLGVGGRARWFRRAETAEDVERAHRWSAANGVPMVVFGGGSNIVVADSGVDGLVLHIGIRGCEWSGAADDTLISAGAGEIWDAVVEASVERGLAGLECLSGIPGTVGGTPIQNVGAYGQEVSETIDRVTAYDRHTSSLTELSASECGFSYRNSRFKEKDNGRFVVCSVRFRLRRRGPRLSYPDIIDYLTQAGVSSPDVMDVRRAVLHVRRRKGMVIDASDVDTRSVGSFFMNPVIQVDALERLSSIAGRTPPSFPLDAEHVKVPAAWLIEHAGFRRGDADGNIGISTKHTLALVNRGGATARDVLRFATRMKRSVMDRFSIRIKPEPVFVGFGDDPELKFLQS